MQSFKLMFIKSFHWFEEMLLVDRQYKGVKTKFDVDIICIVFKKKNVHG